MIEEIDEEEIITDIKIEDIINELKKHNEFGINNVLKGFLGKVENHI